MVKDYGSKRALDGLSFNVGQGEIFALLGPNGAGKTTTVEILEGYRQRDQGEVRILGFDPDREGPRIKPQLGVMLQENSLYPAATPREILTLFASFYERPLDTDHLLQLVGLTELESVRFRRLSGGQKQRLSLALALIGRPRLVFLDEPTAGLDPQARRSTWEIIGSLREQDVTVVLTTHYLEEAERLADRVAIINQGKLVALGTAEELVRSDSSSVRLRTAAPVRVDLLRRLPAARTAEEERPGIYRLETTDAASLLVQVTTCLQDVGIGVVQLEVGEGSLEDVFMRLTGEGTDT